MAKAKKSHIIQVSTREEHEKQAATISAFVSRMTREFMAEFEFTNLQKRLEQEKNEKDASEDKNYFYAVEEEPEQVISARERKQEVFEAKREQHRMKTQNALAKDMTLTEQTCNNGHQLYVARRTKKNDPRCFHCNDEILYKAQMITCTGKCGCSMCLKCSGCCNGHVLHRKIVKEPLSTKNNSCLRCMKGLGKAQAVNWCVDCKQAFWAENCGRESQ